MSNKPAYGIYDALLDKELRDVLDHYPELRAVLGKVDHKEQPARYAAFVARVVEQALREETDSAARLVMCNRLIEIISKKSEHLEKHQLVDAQRSILLEITPPNYGTRGVPRPQTSLAESSLFTGSPTEPQLVHDLLKEMRSADEVDVLVLKQARFSHKLFNASS